MKDKLRQLLALILALSICFSLLSANVWATDEPEDVPTENPEVVTEEDKSEDKQEETPAETQNEEKQEEAPAETQNENKQEEAPAEAQSEEKQEETPAETQSENKQEETPAETQSENKQEETPAETQSENKQEETPAEAQPENKQEEPPAETQSENKQEETPTETQPQPMKKKAMGKIPGMSLTAYAATLKGSGTADDPYQISTKDDWDVLAGWINSGMNADKYYKQTSDISGISVIVGNSQNTPFKGTYDGNGYTIEAAIDATDNEYAAPFQYADGAVIKNVKMTGSIKGGKHCSGLVGTTMNSPITIQSCEVAATITTTALHWDGSRAMMGGLVGHGQGKSNTVSDCLFSGRFDKTASNGNYCVGAIYGWSGENAKASNCLVYGYEIVTGNAWVNGVQIGRGLDSSKTINCYSRAEGTTGDLVESLGSGWIVVDNMAVPNRGQTHSVPATNKTALNNAITEAETYYNSIKDSHSDTAATLKDAIDAAKSVKDNADATQTEVDNALTALNGAKTTAEAAVLTETKTALDDAITEAETYYNSIKDTNPAAAAALKDAIDAAKAVQGNADATQEQVDAALAALTGAKSTAEETVLTETKTALDDAITEAEAYYNSIKDTNPAAAAALKDAIDAAKAVKDNTDATQEQVDATIAALAGAKTTAEAAVLTETKTALNNAITEAETYYNSIKDSNPDAAATLLTAINAAKAVKDNADATQEQVDAAIAALAGAKTTAEDTVLTETKTALNNAITEAETYYESIKDSNPAVAATLKDAIDAAKAVQGNADATQEQVDAALAALTGAKSTAEETVLTETKTALDDAITEAETYYESIKDSNPDAAATLLTAINAAKAVKDNTDATQTEVDNALTALNGAKTTAEAAVLTETKTALNNAITEAETYYESIKDSNPDAAATLKDAIDAAKAVQGNADATQEQADNTIAAITGAKRTAEATVLAETISQVMSEVSANTSSDMTYTGNPIRLINTPTTALPAGYTMKYAVATENVAPMDENLYTTSIPTATDAGTYYVWYKVVGDSNHTDVAAQSISVTITKAPLTVTAKDKAIAYGEAPANDGVKYVGFAEGEDEKVLTGELSYAYNYKQGDNSGEYTITPSGLTSENYEITFVAGKLTVKALGEAGITVTTEGDDSRLDIELDQESAEKLLTEDELKDYNNGVSATVYVLVDELSASDVPAADKKLAEEFLKDGKIGQYLDLTLWVKVGNRDARQITNAASNITLKIAIPEKLQSKDAERTFYLIRVHDGKAESLASTTGDTLEADSRLFSTYAIGYKDTEVKDDTKKDDTKKDTTTKTKTNTSKTDTTKKSSGRSPKTGDAAMLGVWFSLAGASATGLGALALGGKRRKNNRTDNRKAGRRLNK